MTKLNVVRCGACAGEESDASYDPARGIGVPDSSSDEEDVVTKGRESAKDKEAEGSCRWLSANVEAYVEITRV